MTSWPISRRQHPNSIEGFLVVGGLGSVFERFCFGAVSSLKWRTASCEVSGLKLQVKLLCSGFPRFSGLRAAGHAWSRLLCKGSVETLRR